MRQPIIVTTPAGVQKYVGNVILRRIVLVTILTLFIIALDIILFVLNGISGLLTNADLFALNWALLVIIGSAYIYMFVMYSRARHRSLPAIIIDEQGIHANKLFIP